MTLYNFYPQENVGLSSTLQLQRPLTQVRCTWHEVQVVWKRARKNDLTGLKKVAGYLVFSCSPSSYRELNLASFRGTALIAACSQPIQCQAVLLVLFC